MIQGKPIRKKPTLGPSQCAHCQAIWYGQFCRGGEQGHRIIPEGLVLCVRCWSALDSFLYRQCSDLYESPRGSSPELHEEARKWIANKANKPLPVKKVYRPGVPIWMQRAIDRGLVEPNSNWVYAITVLNGEPVSVEKSQDSSVLQPLVR